MTQRLGVKSCGEPESEVPLEALTSRYGIPAMASKGTILITGLNGYLAGVAAEAALKEGYNVRGTVRTLEKGRTVQKALADRGYDGRVELVETPDITLAGAFDEAVKGNQLNSNFAAVLSLYSW
jgi:nucleoside-diphosphate-sugar epimerase